MLARITISGVFSYLYNGQQSSDIKRHQKNSSLLDLGGKSCHLKVWLNMHFGHSILKNPNHQTRFFEYPSFSWFILLAATRDRKQITQGTQSHHWNVLRKSLSLTGSMYKGLIKHTVTMKKRSRILGLVSLLLIFPIWFHAVILCIPE